MNQRPQTDYIIWDYQSVPEMKSSLRQEFYLFHAANPLRPREPVRLNLIKRNCERHDILTRELAVGALIRFIW